MYHIFTTLPTELLIKLHDAGNCQKTLEAVESFIFRFIPLSDQVEGETSSSLITIQERRENLINIMKKEIGKSGRSTYDSVRRIAKLTLYLCNDFLLMPENATFLPAESNKSLSSSTLDDYKPVKEWMADLQNSLFKCDELENFLLLSYFYNGTFIAPDEESNSSKLKKEEKIKQKDLQSIVDDVRNDPDAKKSKISDYVSNFQKKDPLFLSAFILPSGKQRTKSSAGNKMNVNKWDIICFQTPLDFPILTSIISTTKKSSPFIINETEQSQDLDLRTFFNENTWMLHYSSEIKGGSIQKHLCQMKELSYYTAETAYVFDQYLLERLAGINYINALYSLSQSIPDSILQSLMKFMSSPLCNMRMRLLEFHAELQKDNLFQEFISHELNEQIWNIYLINLLEYHLNCTLPILDVVFHYLMALALKESLITSGEDYRNSMEQFFSDLCKSDKFKFYQMKNAGSVVPARCGFTLDDLNPHIRYGEFSFDIYKNFYYDMIRRAENNLFRILDQSDIRNVIIEAFCKRLTYSFPPEIKGIITES